MSPLDEDLEQGRPDTITSTPGGTKLFLKRTDGSVHSSKSGESQWGIPQASSYERVGPFLRRLLALKNRTTTLEESVPQSFSQVWWELDDIWKEVNDLQTKHPSLSQGPLDTQPLFQGQGTRFETSTATPMLSPPGFQQLMWQVIHELCQSGFVLQSNLDAIGVSGFQLDTRP
jgi:hypothetical protein